MINSSEQAEAATRLLLLAMTPPITPANNTEYGELLTRFSTDPDFKTFTRAVARGMGVQIYTGVIQHGLILVPQEDGFFCPQTRQLSAQHAISRARHLLADQSVIIQQQCTSRSSARDPSLGKT